MALCLLPPCSRFLGRFQHNWNRCAVNGRLAPEVRTGYHDRAAGRIVRSLVSRVHVSVAWAPGSRVLVKEQRSVFARGLRVIGSYIATHPWPFATAVTGATVYAGMTVASTIVLGPVIDHVLIPAFKTGVSGSTVAWGVVAIMAVGVVRAGGIITRRYFAGMTGSRMRATLTTRVVDRYQQLPLEIGRAHV